MATGTVLFQSGTIASPPVGLAIMADAVLDSTLGAGTAQYIKIMDGAAGGTAKAGVTTTNGLSVDVTRVQGTVQVLGSVQGVGTFQVLGSVQPVGTSQIIGTAQLVGTMPIGTVAGTVQVLGSVQGVGTFQVLGSVQTVGTSQIIGTVQSLAGSVHLATNLAGGTMVAVGSALHGATADTRPVLLGGFGSSGTQVAVADGQAVRAWFDLNGRQQIRGTIDTLLGTVQVLGSVQGVGTFQVLGSVQTVGTSQVLGTAQLVGTIPVGTIAGTVQVLGSVQGVGTFQVLGSVQGVGTFQVLGSVQGVGTFQVLGTVQTFGTSQILGTVQNTGTVSIGTIAGTVQVLGTVATFPLYMAADVTLTRPADTTTYTANDEMTDTGGAIRTITSAARASGGMVRLRAASCIDSSNVAAKAQLLVFIFDTTSTPATDNAAFAPADSVLNTCVGILPFNIWYPGDDTSGAGGNAFSPYLGPEIDMKTAASANLFFRVKVLNAYVPTSSEAFVFRFDFLEY